LVFSTHNSTEEAIRKTIEASQRMIIMVNSQREEEGINPAIKRHFRLEIETLQNAPRRVLFRITLEILEIE
jgi:hypothetical protein